jgi:hypothetical protein
VSDGPSAATVVGWTLMIAAVGWVLAIALAAFTYNKIQAGFDPDPRMSGPATPTPEESEHFRSVQRRFQKGSVRLLRRSWPVCLVVAVLGVVLIIVG